jgi:hypothetical protein
MSRVPTRRSEGLSVPFVLTGEDLKKLHKALTAFGDSVTYEVKCADHLTRELDFKKLTEYENPPNKAIRSIKVHARKQNEYDRSATIDIGEGFRSTFDLYLNGPESEVEKLNDAIEDILAGMRPWYWWLTRFSFFITLGIVFALMWAVGVLMTIVLRCRGHTVSTESGGDSNAFVFGVALAACMIAAALDKSKSWIFPRATFAIGQGKRRHETRETVRWVFVGTLGLGIVASLVAGVLLMPFTR